MIMAPVLNTIRIQQRWKSLLRISSSAWILLLSLVLISMINGASSFSVPRFMSLPVPRLRGSVQYWELRRLRHSHPHSITTTTCLLGSTEHEIEKPMKINGDLNGFLANGKSAGNSSTSSATRAHSRQEATVLTMNGSSTQHDNGYTNNGIVKGESPRIDVLPSVSLDELDVPHPTVNGGFTHTSASRAKIGAANKGRTPWNKGHKRSEEDKARIAAGVRARNRERFLQKLIDMEMTEEEYEENKKEERRAKDSERRARRTEKGGYRPTEETKAKISRILKDKHARGEIKRRSIDPTKVRRGFIHSEETKNKISESLRNRWAADPKYRERMQQSMKTAYSKDEVRKKVSVTLKKKWQDPEFRLQMLEKINHNRTSPNITMDYREKISNAMKAKWQDPEYREKTLNGIAKRNNETLAANPRRKKPPKSKPPQEARMLKSIAVREATTKRTVEKKPKPGIRKSDKLVNIAKTKSAKVNSPDSEKPTKTVKEPDGSVTRLREERRDLFDLLYGDETFNNDSDNDGDESFGNYRSGRLTSQFDLGDDDLDSYDPYGLDNY